LIVIDCPPSWSHLITNALVACDVLVSPLECKISQFNSLPVFKDHLRSFREIMDLKFGHLYIPTRFMANKKLSTDIRNWYTGNLGKMSANVVRETAFGEEAIASKISIMEYAPTSLYAEEMREILKEIWSVAVPKTAAERVAS
jgi:chromosome partitioning protein